MEEMFENFFSPRFIKKIRENNVFLSDLFRVSFIHFNRFADNPKINIDEIIGIHVLVECVAFCGENMGLAFSDLLFAQAEFLTFLSSRFSTSVFIVFAGGAVNEVMVEYGKFHAIDLLYLRVVFIHFLHHVGEVFEVVIVAVWLAVSLFYF